MDRGSRSGVWRGAGRGAVDLDDNPAVFSAFRSFRAFINTVLLNIKWKLIRSYTACTKIFRNYLSTLYSLTLTLELVNKIYVSIRA